MNTYIYDLEVYPNLFVGQFYNLETNEFHTYHLDPTLADDIINNSDVTLIGWNSHMYDDIILKYIVERYTKPNPYFKTATTEISTQDIYELSVEIINRGLQSDRVWDLRWADTQFKTYDIKALLDPLPGLKKIAMRIRYNRIQDLPVDPHHRLTDEEITTVTEYCKNDVGVTCEVYETIAKEHITLREHLAGMFKLPPTKLTSASEAKTAEYILSTMACKNHSKSPYEIREYKTEHMPEAVHLSKCIPDWIQFSTPELQEILTTLKHTILPIGANGYADGASIKQKIKIANKEYKFGIGGLHSIDPPGIWSASTTHVLTEADVTSYYPSILLRDNLYPDQYPETWIDAYRSIYDTRLIAKHDGNKLDANALKIVLNATFGKLGSQFSSFYDPTLLVRITLTGQLGLLMLIESCHEQNIEVISANTDGIVVHMDKTQQPTFDALCQAWEQATLMNLEYNQYSRYARRDVNSYTALTADNKIKNKGVFVPPDIKHDVKAPIIQKMARHVLLYGETPEEYLKDNLEDLNIYDFLFGFAATSKFTVSLHTGEVQKELSKTNRWYITDRPVNNKLMKFGGKRQHTINITDNHNIVLSNDITDDSIPKDINIDYYFKKAEKLIADCGG